MNIFTLINLFHIIFVGSLFIYVGTYREKLPKILFPLLFILGIIVIFYHIYKTYTYITQGKQIWINLIHICIIGPLLCYIGYNRDKTTRPYFELLLMLGFAAIGYHSYYLIKG